MTVDKRVALMLIVAAAGCRATEGSVIPGASVARGKQSVAGFGCGTCHEIAGVRDA